jgi:rare lipoprotein A
VRPLAAALAWVLLLAGPGGAAADGAGPAPPPALEQAAEATPDAGAGTGLRAEPPARAEIEQALQREIDRGKASWYGKRFHGRRTASGERFNMYALTAAHPSLPFGTRLRVRHVESGREVEVRINDRGPHVDGRILDLSQAAAQALGMLSSGTSEVVLVEP